MTARGAGRAMRVYCAFVLCRLHGMQEKRDMDTALASSPSQRAVHEMEVNCVTCTHA